MNASDLVRKLPRLETERLVLRKARLTDKDIENLLECLAEPDVVQYMPWYPLHHYDQARSFLTRNLIEPVKEGKEAQWAIIHKADKKLIGNCSLINWTAWHNKAEMAYFLAKPYWGQGYTVEAARAVLAFGFEQMRLNRIEARCMLLNRSSERVMEKLGMKFIMYPIN